MAVLPRWFPLRLDTKRVNCTLGQDCVLTATDVAVIQGQYERGVDVHACIHLQGVNHSLQVVDMRALSVATRPFTRNQTAGACLRAKTLRN